MTISNASQATIPVASASPTSRFALGRRAVGWASGDAGAGFLLSFLTVLVLAADSGGYWPTAWNRAALILLGLGAVAALLRQRIGVGVLDRLFPLGLLLLTAWGALSGLWSSSFTEPLLQSQRTLTYAAAVLAALLVVRGAGYGPLLTGIWAAVTLVSVYSLLTRLLPLHYGVTDRLAGYRLEAPLGYWNALGMLATIGLLIGVGLSVRAEAPALRFLAGASTVILATAVYFTFSRGAWAAAAVGLVVALALDPGRLQLSAAVLPIAPFPVLAVLRASQSGPLTRVGTPLAVAERAGVSLLPLLLLLALGAGGAAVAVALLARRLRPPRLVRIAYGFLLFAALIAAGAVEFDRHGSPVALARRAYANLVGPTVIPDGNLNTRLDSLALGQRIPQWHVAWHEFTAHPLLGGGLGSYERYWLADRPWLFQVVNVHNLYLETLAELGPVGLALLVLTLVLPLLAAVRARGRALVPVAAGAYVAFLAHAAVDWDWQMPALTLAALFCGAALLIAGRRSESDRPTIGVAARRALLALLAVLALGTFAGLQGNSAIAAAERAAAQGDPARAAADARSARLWAPWSSQPWQLLGEAQTAAGDRAAAAASLEKAISLDRDQWGIWRDLARVTTGSTRRRALAQAHRLDPLAPVPGR